MNEFLSNDPRVLILRSIAGGSQTEGQNMPNAADLGKLARGMGFPANMAKDLERLLVPDRT